VNQLISFLPEELSSLLGKGDVDKDSGSHFESGSGGQSRNNLKMPMERPFSVTLNSFQGHMSRFY
jgi:hypothetical protein